MSKSLNLWSFLIMVVCVGLFLIQSFIYQLMQPGYGYKLILGITLMSFILGIIGMFAIDNWKSAFRSVMTILFSVSLTVVLTFIVFIGLLFD